jgi:hypothetical protein
MWNSPKLLAIFPAAILLVCNGLIAQNKSPTEPIKPFDNTLKWELPYEAPADKIKKLQEGIKSIKLRMTYAQTVARMGAPDAVYDLRQDFFALGPQEDSLLISYRNNFSFRVIWYLSKTGTAPNLKDKWFALYLATDKKTVLARMANNMELPKAQ